MRGLNVHMLAGGGLFLPAACTCSGAAGARCPSLGTAGQRRGGRASGADGRGRSIGATIGAQLGVVAGLKHWLLLLGGVVEAGATRQGAEVGGMQRRRNNVEPE